ncbi:MAG: hypothetical protein EKK48_12045 [Candidatus Melainabacteria bacterium]|nr:MAG: hypothetical protein EKK48_12045 [Candidatus Melainabacteria bacterium]
MEIPTIGFISINNKRHELQRPPKEFGKENDAVFVLPSASFADLKKLEGNTVDFLLEHNDIEPGEQHWVYGQFMSVAKTLIGTEVHVRSEG